MAFRLLPPGFEQRKGEWIAKVWESFAKSIEKAIPLLFSPVEEIRRSRREPWVLEEGFSPSSIPGLVQSTLRIYETYPHTNTKQP